MRTCLKLIPLFGPGFIPPEACRDLMTSEKATPGRLARHRSPLPPDRLCPRAPEPRGQAQEQQEKDRPGKPQLETNLGIGASPCVLMPLPEMSLSLQVPPGLTPEAKCLIMLTVAAICVKPLRPLPEEKASLILVAALGRSHFSASVFSPARDVMGPALSSGARPGSDVCAGVW
jgi:hypothetical protein